MPNVFDQFDDASQGETATLPAALPPRRRANIFDRFDDASQPQAAPAYDPREGRVPTYRPELFQSPPPKETGWRDYVAPIFGGHDPIGEVYSTFVEPFTDISSERSVGVRAQDTINFLASVPFRSLRLPSPGELIEGATGLSGARESEERFAEQNPDIVKALGAAGEVAAGTMGAPGAGRAPQMASMPSSAPARARQFVSDLDELGITRHGPAIAQAARDAEGLGTVAKVVEGMPVVSAPLRRSTREFVESAARAGDTIAGQYGSGNIARAGETLRTYLDDFANNRAIPRDAVEAMSDVEVRGLAQRTPRDVQSLKTAQDARYESAWREIPERMRRGASAEGEPRLMGDMPATRAVLEDIAGRNQRMTLQSGTNAAPAGATAPIASGGLLGEIVRAITHRTSRGVAPWRANLQTMRDIRSTVRRIGSKTTDTEANTLSRADLARMESAVTQDMLGLMQRIAADAREVGQHDMARGFERAMAGFQVADRFTRRYAEAFEAVKRLTKSTRDEQAIGTIIQASQAGARGDMNLLLQLRRITPPEVLDDVAAAVINELGRPTGRAGGIAQEAGWSIAKFASQWDSMSPQGRYLIFGHRPGISARLQRFANVARGLKDYELLANTSKSGTHGIVGTIILAGPAAIIGNLQGILLSGATAYGIAKWLTSDAYVSWLMRSMRLQDRIARGNLRGRAATSQTRQLGRDLATLIKGDRTIDPETARGVLIGIERSLSGVSATRADGTAERGQGATLSEYDPDIKERISAWFGRQFGDTRASHATGRKLAEALDLMSLFALTGASSAERNVREGVDTGSAGQVALGVGEAIFGLIPAFRGPKALAARVAQDIKRLERELEVLTGRPPPPRPRPIPGTPAEKSLKYEEAYRDRLASDVAAHKEEIARANARAAPGSVPSVDLRDMRAEEQSILDWLAGNRAGRAFKGRQGFYTMQEQEAAARRFFAEGGRLPPAPWGKAESYAGDAARDILAFAFVSRPAAEQRAIVEGARRNLIEANRAVDALRKRQLKARTEEAQSLRAELAQARQEAEEAKRRRDFYRDLYERYKGMIDKYLKGRD